MMNDTNIYKKIRLGILALFVCTAATAQNNAYKLNDDVYNYFVYVDKQITLEGSPKRCDSLFALARSKGDLKGQCLAKYEKTAYYCARKDSVKLIRSVDEAKEFCAATPYQQYYFGSWDNLINYYISQRNFEAALVELNIYQKEALKKNDKHGTAYSMILTGNIYYYSHHYLYALYKYQQALKYCKETNYVGIASLHEYMSFTYYQLQEYDKAIASIEEVLKDPQTSDNYKTLSHHMALLYSCSKEKFNKEEATRWYNLASKDEYTLENQVEDYQFFESIKELYLARLNGVKWKNFSSIPDMMLPTYRVRNMLNLQKKDYATALPDLIKINHYERANEREASYIILDYRTGKRQRELQEQRKDSIEQAKTTLALAEARLQQNKLLMQMEQQKLELSQRHLRNKKMEQTRKAQEAKTQKLKRRQELEAQRSNIREREEQIRLRKQRIQIAVAALLIFAIVVCSIFIIVYTRSRLKMLSMERKKAYEADREKTLFYRTMSTEIRTPLNAILGFNEILNSEVANELSDEEKKKIAGYIRANSELLTTMVNDVLDISKLESGTYKLYYSDFTVRSLADTVILTTGTDNDHHNIVLEEIEDETLHTDRQRLQQLLIILTSYACRNCRDNIYLSSSREEDGRTFRIRFTGKKEDMCKKVDELLKSNEKSQRDTLLDNNGNIRIAVLITRLFKGKLYTESTENTNECILCFKMPMEPVEQIKEGACA